MLYNLPSLSTAELEKLFLTESRNFMNGLDKIPYNELQAIRINMVLILEELEKRRNAKKK
jgi:hypothetical protein